MATLTVLQEMTELGLTRPGINADDAAVAGWHERRAAMLAHIAASGGPGAERARELAHRAQQRARQLMDGAGCLGV